MKPASKKRIVLLSAALFLAITALEPALHDHAADCRNHSACLACHWTQSSLISPTILVLGDGLLLIELLIIILGLGSPIMHAHPVENRGPPSLCSF
jgi:hypothetical protein